jgi:predicted RNA-binding protein with PUA-like domain
MPKYWLMKTEPDTFSIDDLERVKIEPWTGVRSMFARFHMRQMTVGDEVLFYHSSCEPPGVPGLAKVVRTKVIDETQFDPASKYFDPKATREKPIWDCVDVEFVRRLPRFVSLTEIRMQPELSDMPLLQRGMRLSVQPVLPEQYARIVALADEPEPPPEALKAVKMPPPKKRKLPPTKKPKPKPAKKPTKKPAKSKAKPKKRK